MIKEVHEVISRLKSVPKSKSISIFIFPETPVNPVRTRKLSRCAGFESQRNLSKYFFRSNHRFAPPPLPLKRGCSIFLPYISQVYRVEQPSGSTYLQRWISKLNAPSFRLLKAVSIVTNVCQPCPLIQRWLKSLTLRSAYLSTLEVVDCSSTLLPNNFPSSRLMPTICLNHWKKK